MPNPIQFKDPYGKNRVAPSTVVKTVLQTNSPPVAATARDVVMLTQFAGGPKDTWKSFANYGDLELWHDPLGRASGVVTDPGCRYAKRIFKSSPDLRGPNQVHTMRVGDPTTATTMIQTEWGGQGVTLTTIEAGAQANQTQGRFTTPTTTAVASAGGAMLQIMQWPGTQGRITHELDNLGVPLSVRADTASSTGTVTMSVAFASTHSFIHQTNDATNDVTTVDATDLATAITLMTALRPKYNTHIGDGGVAPAIHYVVDATNTVTVGPIVTQGDLNTAAILMKTKFNTHITNTGGDYHEVGGSAASDPYRTIVAADATSLATSITLVNQLKHFYNSHTKGASTNEVATLSIVNSAPVAGYEGTNVSFDLTAAANDTLGELVQLINARAGLNAKITPGVDSGFPTIHLDPMTSTSILSDTVWLAVPSLIYHPAWEASRKMSTIVGVTYPPGVVGTTGDAAAQGYALITSDAYTEFTGGTDDTVDATDYSNALDEITNNDQLVGGHLFLDAAGAIEPTVRSTLLTWLDTERSDEGRIWRVFMPKLTSITMGGPSIGVIDPSLVSYKYTNTDAEVEDLTFDAAKLNHTQVGYEWQRLVDVGNDGETYIYGPLDRCALKTGMSASTRKTRPLSGLSIQASGVVDQPTPVQTDNLLMGGCNVCAPRGRVIQEIMAISSRVTQKRMEIMWSELGAGVYLEDRVRFALQVLTPRWGGIDLVTRAEDTVEAILLEETQDVVPEDGVALLSPGTDADGNPTAPFDGIQATLYAGVLTVNWNAYIAGEVDHVFSTGRINYQTFGVTVSV